MVWSGYGVGHGVVGSNLSSVNSVCMKSNCIMLTDSPRGPQTRTEYAIYLLAFIAIIIVDSVLCYIQGHEAAHRSMPAQDARTPRSKAIDYGEDETWQAIMLSSPEAQDDADDWEAIDKAEADPSDLGYYDETVVEKQIEDEWTSVSHIPTIQRDWQKVAVKANQTPGTTATTTAKGGVAAQRGTMGAKSPQSHRSSVQSPLKDSVVSADDGGYHGDVEVASGHGSSTKPSLNKRNTKKSQLPVPKAARIEGKVSSYLSFQSLGVPPPRSSGGSTY
ncbi:hypothetical protein F4776DRAFT_209740 [Hypoxylon sp. NC0597]|nr:hypothetical protein F4776DRAFT_209740 [Hypoxylon sp. NC0597]